VKVHWRGFPISISALILGTLHGQAEPIQRLRDRGWTVYSCGHRREGPGVACADEFFEVDILAVDKVEALARDLNVDLVYSVGSDIAMPTVATVSERLGLPMFHTVEQTEVLHRKVNLRSFLSKYGLSPVVNLSVKNPADLRNFSRFPAIVKPSDSQGQRGITVVQNMEEAIAAVPVAIESSSSCTAIIEEFLDGPEVSVHVFAVDRKVQFQLVSDRHVWDGPLTGVPSAHTVPSRFVDAQTLTQIDDLVREVVRFLEVTTGPMYFQLILTEHGPRIVEIAPRLDGCHLWRLVELHTGFNILDRCFELLAGEPWQAVDYDEDGSTHELQFLLADPSNVFHAADWQSDASSTVLYEEFQVEEGQHPRRTNDVVARLGFRIVEVL
jgi:biotin carboxylase